MRVVLYGATGRAGSRILQELRRRGHRVTGVTRDGKAPSDFSDVDWKVDDLSSADRIAKTIEGADALVSAYAPPPDATDSLVGVCERLAEAVARGGSGRLLVVGGAGVLKVAPGVTLIESGKLPPEWMPIAVSHARALEALRASHADWTYISPAAFFEPGERTGSYRASKDTLLTDAQGESRISMEDYAIAMVDEMERGSHRRESFAVGW
jgi:putative NADH-flavin reductase